MPKIYLTKLPCSSPECNRIAVGGKDVCKNCYQKIVRQTPEGKQKLALYNSNYNSKHKKEIKSYHKSYYKKNYVKKQKEIKFCECKNIALVKGNCSKCYQRQYKKKQYYKAEKNDFKLFNLIYQRVLEGNTIEKSCKIEKIDRVYFYKQISKEQSLELKAMKKIFHTKNIKNVIKDDDITNEF